MTRFVLTPEAESDISDILIYLRREAGLSTAEEYRRRIQETIRRLRTFPSSGVPRPAFGQFMRMAIVYPYVLFYDYEPRDDRLTLLRVLHGRTDLEDKLLPR
jgi:toxin ParE1/3/4